MDGWMDGWMDGCIDGLIDEFFYSDVSTLRG